ncbi:5-carboxy-2-hydroxymuconate semialdehyde dehydrogenase [Salmonella enterica subsp. enterica]|uniref:5-carboxy-2-hydroxymuconate semialdehyde dehydrogenase n=1 Tax=Salmonella enterica I TaxID=59201 RepID=A0A379WVZ3_SALET|nr:5-carboxy-2-hydroxymuconate semialdehyde dehydrogenase [Salmonella enterica subsp. enterica]
MEYGLASYIWTQDVSKVLRLARGIEAGMVFVNTQNVRDLRQPFGGVKASGTGREGGEYSFEVFAEMKNVCISMGDHPIPKWGSLIWGKLALAAKITHVPSMYLSELPGKNHGCRQAAIDGHIEIGKRCREMGVDTIIVFDTPLAGE